MGLRSSLYKIARIMGDVNAVKKIDSVVKSILA